MIGIKRGDTFEYTGPVTLADGSALDLTDWAVSATLQWNDGTTPVSLDCSITNPTGGVIKISKAAATTATWPIGTGVFDIKFVDPDGRVIRSPNVAVEVSERVTD